MAKIKVSETLKISASKIEDEYIRSVLLALNRDGIELHNIFVMPALEKLAQRILILQDKANDKRPEKRDFIY